MYWEGHRRQDLIRFGKYKDMSWEWKGGSAIGNTTLSDYQLIFPIPNKELKSNKNLSQNPGY
ncbi:MAG: RagB/SusD family nutrient uptake outer membrane protein [Flavobacteriales bacterium]|nr:RagB/SusD family nutrient uptake outer membrane protein [Flavobacteriales bacterium]